MGETVKLILLLLINEEVDEEEETVVSLFLRCNDKFKPGRVVRDILTSNKNVIFDG
jgi:hypothetical protein